MRCEVKRIVPVLLLICICLTGCSLKKVVELDGREQVEAFIAEAAGWQSGCYVLTNLDTGEADSVFTFINGSDGVQSYLYESIADGAAYVEYSDGKIFCTVDGDEMSICNEGDEGYVSYTAENPHPYSTGNLLFYVNLYASGSTAETDSDGNVTYTYIYDVGKINKAMGTSLDSFVTTFTFDADGNFVNFTQSNTDGESSYAYMVEVLDVNSVAELENPLG